MDWLIYYSTDSYMCMSYAYFCVTCMFVFLAAHHRRCRHLLWCFAEHNSPTKAYKLFTCRDCCSAHARFLNSPFEYHYLFMSYHVFSPQLPPLNVIRIHPRCIHPHASYWRIVADHTHCTSETLKDQNVPVNNGIRSTGKTIPTITSVLSPQTLWHS